MFGIAGGFDELAQGDLDAPCIAAAADDFTRHQTAHDEEQGRGDSEHGQTGQLAETIARQRVQ
jgi:hypothetical protein